VGKKEYFYSWLIAILTILISINTGSPLAFFVFIILLFSLSISLLYPLITSKHIQVKRIYIKPNQVYKNQNLKAYITIKNEFFLPVLFLRITIDNPEILESKEALILYLKPYGEIETEIDLKAKKRGYIEAIKIAIQLSLIFRLFRPLKIEKQVSLYIYPNFAIIDYQNILKISPESSISSYYKLSEEGEFFSLRDYYFDDIKKIAWKQWAKTGRLVVKQKAQFIIPHINIIINNITTTPEQDEEFIEKVNTLLKNIILSNNEIRITTLDKLDSFKKINNLQSSLVYLSELNFISYVVKSISINIDNFQTFFICHHSQPKLQLINVQQIVL